MACTPAAEREVYLQVLGSFILQRAKVGVKHQPFRKALLSKSQLAKVVK